MSSQSHSFLDGPSGPISLRGARPINFVMGMNGALTVADTLFLGHAAGPKAPAALTLMFPLQMPIESLATPVSSAGVFAKGREVRT